MTAARPAAPAEDMTLTARENGILGSSLQVRLRAAPLEGGLYAVARDEWDRTLGPIFDRTVEGMIGHNRRNPGPTTPMGAIVGYNAMDPAQAKAFHTLVQAFSVVRDPDYLRHLGGDHAEKLARFAAAYADGQVLVNRHQLDGLTAVAREAAEFAREDSRFDHIDAFYDRHVHGNPQMRYRHGILNALT